MSGQSLTLFFAMTFAPTALAETPMEVPGFTSESSGVAPCDPLEGECDTICDPEVDICISVEPLPECEVGNLFCTPPGGAGPGAGTSTTAEACDQCWATLGLEFDEAKAKCEETGGYNIDPKNGIFGCAIPNTNPVGPDCAGPGLLCDEGQIAPGGSSIDPICWAGGLPPSHGGTRDCTEQYNTCVADWRSSLSSLVLSDLSSQCDEVAAMMVDAPIREAECDQVCMPAPLVHPDQQQFNGLFDQVSPDDFGTVQFESWGDFGHLLSF